MKERGFYIVLFWISFMLLAIFNLPGSISGNVINVSNFVYSELNVFLIMFMFASLILFFTAKKSLDLIIIPTGGEEQNKQRVSRALEEAANRGTDSYLISGGKDTPKIKDSQRGWIYGKLREVGIPPKKIKIAGGEDTEENMRKIAQRLKKEDVKTVGIVSYPAHLDRFEDNMRKYADEMPEDVSFERIETNQTMKQTAYAALNKFYHKYVPKKGFNKIRQIVRKLMS